MEKRIIITFLFFLFSGFGAKISGMDAGEKLKGIRSSIENTNEKLQVYEKLQSDLSSDLDVLGKSKSKTTRQIDDTGLSLTSTRENMLAEKRKQSALSFAYEKGMRRLNDRFLIFFISQKIRNPYFENAEIMSALISKYYVYHKTMLLKILKERILETTQSLDFLKKETENLSDSLEILKKEEEKIIAKLENKKGKLTDAKTTADKIRAEIENLRQSEKDLVAMLVDLNKRSIEKMFDAKPSLSIAKNSLDWPSSGRVISHFGKKKITSLDIEFNRQGIKIETPRNAEVRSVAAGVVIYKGYFRSYKNVIILDHGREFFTIYGFLSKFLVEKGDIVSTGETLAISGDDETGFIDTEKVSSDKSVLYFEIRAGTNPLNPLDWLKADL